MNDKEFIHLGEPALKFMGLQLWIHGYEYPDSPEVHDDNWLRATAHCGESGASVWVKGSFLMTSDLEMFLKQCEELLRGHIQEAEFKPLEPALQLKLKSADKLGHLTLNVQITPDHMHQEHIFEFEVDQSYLPMVIEQCQGILRRYPVRGRDAGSV